MPSPLARQIEALLVASPRPQSLARLRLMLGAEAADAAVQEIADFWSGRGMELSIKGDDAALVPSKDVVTLMERADRRGRRKLTEAAVETLCFIAFHQPVTVPDIEKARGVALNQGVIDSLLDSGFVRSSLRKTNSGRAVMYVTTDLFLDHYALTSLADLPSLEEMEDLLNPPIDDQMENDSPQPQDERALGLEMENFSSVSDTVQSS